MLSAAYSWLATRDPPSPTAVALYLPLLAYTHVLTPGLGASVQSCLTRAALDGQGDLPWLCDDLLYPDTHWMASARRLLAALMTHDLFLSDVLGVVLDDVPARATAPPTFAILRPPIRAGAFRRPPKKSFKACM